MEDESYEFDAIVVGSGVSGGWAAKELCERGLKTLVLDRGRMVRHREDYVHEHKAEWDMPYRGKVHRDELERDYFIARHSFLTDFNKPFYNNDRLNPYDYDGGKPFRWVRGSAVGGRSLIWGRWVFRWSDLDFAANARDGHGMDWPIRYRDVAPWYAHVERFIGVSGSSEGLAHLPDGVFQPPHPLNVAEAWLKQQIEGAFEDRYLIPARSTNMTEDKPEQGRTRCQYRAKCNRGCSFGAYFSSQSSTLPAAEKTGRLTLRADSVVASLTFDAGRRRVTGVQVVDATDGSQRTYRARVVFLCASAIASLQVMLNSRSIEAPRGVGNSSGLLGTMIMDHPKGAGGRGVIPGFTDYMEYGRRPVGVHIPRFRNVARQDDVTFLRGYHYECRGLRSDPQPTALFGQAFKEQMRVPGPWIFKLNGFGECLPYRDNRIRLHPKKTDRYGIPLVTFEVSYRDNERAMLLDMEREARIVLEAAGCANIETWSKVDEQWPGYAIHEMGGAPMGRDPARSVLNEWSQCHDAPNLFVTDGAQFNSASCVNPSLTYMALTARAANYAADQLAAGQL
jgi:choline dehydrogenase-like flavoprotein